MATIASLSEGPEVQDLTQTTPIRSEPICEGYNDKCEDHKTKFQPALEAMSFISPDSVTTPESSPPIATSPTANSGRVQETPRRHVVLSHLQRVKPGCNGAANLGTKSVTLSDMPGTSTNTIASESDGKQITEEDGTANTLQLIQTKRAQVNCASFSMKDILRQFAHDDSMDSDSRDTAAVVLPPPVKRAQVKSTSLSMNDIRILTKPHLDEDACQNNSLISKLDATQNNPLISKLNVSEQKVKKIENTLLEEDQHLNNTIIPETQVDNLVVKTEPEEKETFESKKAEVKCTNLSIADLMKMNTFPEDTLVENKVNPIYLNDDRSISDDEVIESTQLENTGGVPVDSFFPDLATLRKSNKTNKQKTLKKGRSKIYSKKTKRVKEDRNRSSRKVENVQERDDGNQEKLSSKTKETVISECIPETQCLKEPVAETPKQVTYDTFFSEISKSEEKNEKSNKNTKLQIPSVEIIPPDESRADQEQVKMIVSPITPVINSDKPNFTLSAKNSDINGNGYPSSLLQPLKVQASDQSDYRHLYNYPISLGVNPTLSHYPYQWQWPVPTNTAIITAGPSSPLNLTTKQNALPIGKRSSENYSPITPPSPVSPQTTTAKISSPPVKKLKNLWYPWLDTGNKEKSPENTQENLWSKIHKKLPERTDKASPHTNSPAWSQESLKQHPMKLEDRKTDVKSRNVLVNKTPATIKASETKTTIYPRELQPENLSLKISSKLYSTSDYPLENRKLHSYPTSVKYTDLYDNYDQPKFRQRSNSDLARSRRESEFGIDLRNKRKRESSPNTTSPSLEQERIRLMLEREKLLRYQYANSISHYHNISSSTSITDRLVTQLIKGDTSNAEPVDGTRGRKRTETKPNESGSTSSRNTINTTRTPTPSSGGNIQEGDRNREKKLSVSSQILVDRMLVIAPVSFPPSRESVQKSIMPLGLNSVQAPTAYCSTMGDLPDRPLEHGGQVLKVDSRRISELEGFSEPSFVDGLNHWRALSLATSSLLSSQPRETVERLHHQPELRFMFCQDKHTTLAPCKLPPRRSSVVKWLQTKMKSLTESKNDKKKDHVNINEDFDREEEDCIKSSGETNKSITSDDYSIDTDLDLSCTLVNSPETPKSTRKTKLQTPSTKQKIDKFQKYGEDFTKITPIKSRNLPSTPLQSPNFPSTSVTPTNTEEKEVTLGTLPHTSTPKILKRISTNTENQLRTAVLLTQTQRQKSELGFTAAEISQIEGPTQQNSFGFKIAEDHLQDAKAVHKYQYVTALSIELHVETRVDLRPDPEFDPIICLFYSIFDDIPEEKGRRNITGVIVVDRESWQTVTDRQRSFDSESVVSQGSYEGTQHAVDTSLSSSYKPIVSASPARKIDSSPAKGKGRGRKSRSPSPSPSRNSSTQKSDRQALLEKCGVESIDVTYVQDEQDLIDTLVSLVSRYDPDILVGYEIQLLSWGYLLQRAAQLNIELSSKLARVTETRDSNQFAAEKDEWGADHMSEIHIAGRVVLNLWRILRHEVTLNTYSYENVAFHVLHRRVPHYPYRALTRWYKHKTHLHRWRVIEYYSSRVKGQLEIIDQLDLIGKTSEFARVFGIEFFDVLARGSQYRVESMMLRQSKPMNYVAVSPSPNQRGRQRAPECIPLTLEPESKYYTSPVVVLDYQSLYPSIMMAYNYCFTTCLGRLDYLHKAHEGPFPFGCTSLNIKPKTLKKLRKMVTISPNGVVFLNSSVRRGVLPRMVEEILDTRVMVKKSMKSYKGDKTLTRMLDARQLSLKLIANVTYGYTGASFSGRMPCIEVADSIVRKARESLERAIKLVEDTPRWRAKVVYGDTDSLFIHFPGRSKDEAFVLGQEIADAVTAMFPKPMKLKFEKVYLPCVLQTKKRYVGFMYETPDQKEPVYDAKGIETVRRDACSAVAKILERSIKVLFSTHDLSRVRSYVCRQLHKIMEAKVSACDLTFAKEFRGLMGYKPGACVPALEIARKRVRYDRRGEPRVGERVPYVIVHGSPGLPLIQLVREPDELIHDPTLRLNATYYITKQILPPLDRLFSLIGVNVFKWYRDMPKVVRVRTALPSQQVKQGTISLFFATTNCPVCEAQTKSPVCLDCQRDPQLVVTTLTHKIRDWDRTYNTLSQICDSCQGTSSGEQACLSLECPVLFRRELARQDLTQANSYRDILVNKISF